MFKVLILILTIKKDDSDEDEDENHSISRMSNETTSSSRSQFGSYENQTLDVDDVHGRNEEEEIDDEYDVNEDTLMDRLEQQEKWYKLGMLEDYCGDTEKCIQRYFKTIYRQVKFFSETKEEIKKPNFVIAEHNPRNESQTVQICNWILVNIGKGNYNIEQKIMFWKTYWRMIYKEIAKLRMTDTNKFKTRFIKGT